MGVSPFLSIVMYKIREEINISGNKNGNHSKKIILKILNYITTAELKSFYSSFCI